jgi:hypothetical protein
MNWEALAAIGEILGATAVLVTIAYLAVQVRQNTASVATATWDSVLTGFNEINVAVANNPELADVVTRGMYDPDSLTDLEGVRFAFIMRAASNQYFKLLRLHEEGALSKEEWNRMAREMGQVLRTEGGRRFRETHVNYAPLYEAVDMLEIVDTTSFIFSRAERRDEAASQGQ